MGKGRFDEHPIQFLVSNMTLKFIFGNYKLLGKTPFSGEKRQKKLYTFLNVLYNFDTTLSLFDFIRDSEIQLINESYIIKIFYRRRENYVNNWKMYMLYVSFFFFNEIYFTNKYTSQGIKI